MIAYVVRDLLFVSKIREAAASLGVELQPVRDVETLPALAPRPRLVVLDLALPESLRALEVLAKNAATTDVATVGFVGHERLDVMETAKALGCGRVMAKGEFATKLGALMREATASEA